MLSISYKLVSAVRTTKKEKQMLSSKHTIMINIVIVIIKTLCYYSFNATAITNYYCAAMETRFVHFMMSVDDDAVGVIRCTTLPLCLYLCLCLFDSGVPQQLPMRRIQTM